VHKPGSRESNRKASSRCFGTTGRRLPGCPTIPSFYRDQRHIPRRRYRAPIPCMRSRAKRLTPGSVYIDVGQRIRCAQYQHRNSDARSSPRQPARGRVCCEPEPAFARLAASGISAGGPWRLFSRNGAMRRALQNPSVRSRWIFSRSGGDCDAMVEVAGCGTAFASENEEE